MTTLLRSELAPNSTKTQALARLAQVRSDLEHREAAYHAARAGLLLAYRQARREGFTDEELSDLDGTRESLTSSSS